MTFNATRSVYAASGALPRPSAPVVNPRAGSANFRPAPDPYEAAAKADEESEQAEEHSAV